MEYARHVLAIKDADFEETTPNSPALLITRLACSLAGQEQEVFISPDSTAFAAYGTGCVRERFRCNFGLNESYRSKIGSQELTITGRDGQGNARIVELPPHPFFLASLFLPQLSSAPGHPHPLIVAFLRAADTFRQRAR